MIEILGDSANPKVNYCLTEIVHCKSKNAIGVKEAAKTCLPNWFEKKMFLCPAPVVIIFGSHARNFLRMELKNASEDFGSEAKYAGMSQRERSLRDISLEVFGGKKRLVIFNFKNGSSQIQKLSEVYGSRVLSFLNAVSRLEEQIPENSNKLRIRLEELF
jgi:hypothetical protein